MEVALWGIRGFYPFPQPSLKCRLWVYIIQILRFIVGYVLLYLIHTRHRQRQVCSFPATLGGGLPLVSIASPPEIAARAMRLWTATSAGHIAHSVGSSGPLPICRRVPPSIGHHPQVQTQRAQARGGGWGGVHPAVAGHLAMAGHPAMAGYHAKAGHPRASCTRQGILRTCGEWVRVGTGGGETCRGGGGGGGAVALVQGGGRGGMPGHGRGPCVWGRRVGGGEGRLCQPSSLGVTGHSRCLCRRY